MKNYGKIKRLKQWLGNQRCHFIKPVLIGINNGPNIESNPTEMADEKIFSVHRKLPNTDVYLERPHIMTRQYMTGLYALPVRFIYCEFAPYNQNPHCNDRYKQAKSIHTIKTMPFHHQAPQNLVTSGYFDYYLKFQQKRKKVSKFQVSYKLMKQKYHYNKND